MTNHIEEWNDEDTVLYIQPILVLYDSQVNPLYKDSQ